MSIREVPALYKFMTSERLMSILKQPSIRFTQPDDLNDPYECHLTLDPKALLKDYRIRRAEAEPGIEEARLDEVVSMAEGTLVENALLRYRKLRQNLGVLSLTDDPFQLLMWSHYGDEHRGAVIELDWWDSPLRPVSNGGDEYAGLEKVEYSKTKIVGIPTPDTMIDVLSTKSKQWSYENEWRLIRTLNLTREVSPGIHVVDFDLGAIRSIYLGARFDATLLGAIKDRLSVLGKSRPPIYKLDLSPRKFELVPTDIERYGRKVLHREHHFGDAAAEALTCIIMEDE